MSSITQARRYIRQLIDDSNPAESPTAYYALFHPKERSTIEVMLDDDGRTIGFVGRFQTGIDLFRPLLTLQCNSPDIAAELLDRSLVAGRPYILFSPLSQLAMVGGSLQINNQRIMQIYIANPSRFSPEINVMVRHNTAHDGTPRCEVRQNGDVLSVAGVNWRSPAFAEIYVHTEPIARQKGYGRSVVACITERLLKDGIRPVYLVETDNAPSRELIESLGYTDTGSRQVFADVVYAGNPLASPP